MSKKRTDRVSAYGIVSRTHHFYDDPSVVRLPKSDAYVYGSPARAPEFPKGNPQSWQRKNDFQITRELEEHDFPVEPSQDRIP